MKKGDPEKLFEALKERVAQIPKPTEQVYYDLAERIRPDDKEYLPRILARLADTEQIKIVAALPDPDVPAAGGKTLEISERFAAKLGMDKAKVQQHIQEMFEEGLIFPTKKGPSMARTFIQLHDAALGNPTYDKKLGREYFDLWGVLEGPMREPKNEDIRPGHTEFRILPRWKSIENVPGVLPYEDVKGILKAQDTIAMLHCGCKRSITDRWCGVPEESCITVGRTAEYNIERNAGRRITYEEALEVLDRFDKHPVCNLTVNQQDVGQLICNCHYCCCPAIKTAAPSRFAAVIDPATCKGCKACLDRCQFGAISMKSYPGLDGERAFINEENCRGCGSCVIGCKAKARTMKIVRPPEHIPESLNIY